MADPFISGKGVSFRLFGFPVLYRWSALALPVFFGATLIREAPSPVRALEVVLALGVAIGLAILVHELGHATTARAFGGTARIELVFLGGLTHHMYPATLSNGRKAAVSFAGTAAGVAAALPVFVLANDIVTNPRTVWELALSWFVLAAGAWGLFNLIPLPGLDGSHILDAAVRAVSPRRAGVIVPVVTTIFATAAIVGIFLWRGAFSAIWLLVIFGPELVNVGERIRRGRDEPLVDEAIAAEEAYRRGDLERALASAELVMAEAGSEEVVDAMVNIRRAALGRLGRIDELFELERRFGAHYALPPLARAKALASQRRYAEAEAVTRTLGPQPEARALLVELLVAQDLDHRAHEVLASDVTPVLTSRIADLESLGPATATRLARLVANSAVAAPFDIALAELTLGITPDVDGLSTEEAWQVRMEWAARTGDGAGFEHAINSIPSQMAGIAVQRRLHGIGRFDHAASLGSALAPEPGSRVILARSLARLGDTDEALRAMDAAVAAGWSDAPEVVTSIDLMSLQGRPEWPTLLGRMAEQAP